MTRGRLFTMALILATLLAEAAEAADFGPAAGEDAAYLLKQALDRLLGSRDAYELYFYPPDPGDPPGFFPMLDLAVEDARIGGIPLARVDLSIRDLQLDVDALERGRIRFTRGRIERLELVLSEQDLSSILKRQSFARKFQNLKVRLSGDTVRLSGRVPVGFLAPEAQLSGGLEVVDGGRKVLFIPDRLTLGGFNSGDAPLARLVDSLNPILNVEDVARRWNLALRITSVQIRSGTLHLKI